MLRARICEASREPFLEGNVNYFSETVWQNLGKLALSLDSTPARDFFYCKFCVLSNTPQFSAHVAQDHHQLVACAEQFLRYTCLMLEVRPNPETRPSPSPSWTPELSENYRNVIWTSLAESRDSVGRKPAFLTAPS